MKRPQRCKRALLALLIFFSIVGISYLIIHLSAFLNAKHDTEEIHFFIFGATVALAILAYYEFSRSNEVNENEFLLFTSNRWNSKEIIIARQILHEIFINSYRDKNGKAKCAYSVALSSVSEKTFQMSKEKGQEGKDFIYLLSLLDYLETLSYFYHKGDLTLGDIQNTCGNNIIFFYESFKDFIENRRNHDRKFFINFTDLYHDLKKCEINTDRFSKKQ